MKPTDVRTVAAYDPSWAAVFASVGERLRVALGPVTLRIDHIGSTAVPGLDAKPIIDVQISVAAFEPLAAFRVPLESCGFLLRPKPEELSRRYFRERPGERRTHIHVRRAGSFVEQLNLLHRGYLRADPVRAGEYARCKHSLAHLLLTDRQAYVDAKGRSSGRRSVAPRNGPIGLGGNQALRTPDWLCHDIDLAYRAGSAARGHCGLMGGDPHPSPRRSGR